MMSAMNLTLYSPFAICVPPLATSFFYLPKSSQVSPSLSFTLLTTEVSLLSFLQSSVTHEIDYL